MRSMISPYMKWQNEGINMSLALTILICVGIYIYIFTHIYLDIGWQNFPVSDLDYWFHCKWIFLVQKIRAREVIHNLAN